MVLAKRNPSGGRRMMRARLAPDPVSLSIITRSIAPILVPSVLRTGVPSDRSHPPLANPPAATGSNRLDRTRADADRLGYGV